MALFPQATYPPSSTPLLSASLRLVDFPLQLSTSTSGWARQVVGSPRVGNAMQSDDLLPCGAFNKTSMEDTVAMLAFCLCCFCQIPKTRD